MLSLATVAAEPQVYHHPFTSQSISWLRAQPVLSQQTLPSATRPPVDDPASAADRGVHGPADLAVTETFTGPVTCVLYAGLGAAAAGGAAPGAAGC